MNSVNIYNLVKNKTYDEFNNAYISMSNAYNDKVLKLREFYTLKDFINFVYSKQQTIEIFDGFVIGYKIQYISKEFDLIQITSDFNTVLNIELKSQVSDSFEMQLKQNYYYLHSKFNNIYLFTYILGDGFYKLLNNSIERATVDEILFVLNNNHKKQTLCSVPYNIFEPSDVLISPINDTQKFLSHQYFLNSEQENVKKGIIKALTVDKLNITLNGLSGTGKSLLLYDIARELSNHYRVLVIFCGNLSDGHYILNTKINNLKIIPAKDIDSENFLYDYVFVDEAQRITKQSWRQLINKFNKNGIQIILTGDIEQFLSKKEDFNSFFKRTIKNFSNSNKTCSFRLNTKVRTNVSLSSYINKLFDYSKMITKRANLDCIYVEKTCSVEETICLLQYYKNKGYIFINFTGARQGDLNSDPYKIYMDYNSHQVVGMEFDKVVVTINENFGYQKLNDGRELLRERKAHPTDDYIYRKMLFQAVSRARKNLAIIIENNPILFTQINNIKLNFINKNYSN